MLVEDCRIVRIGIRTILDEHPDFTVIGESDSAEAAIESMATLNPDLILLDLGLPGLSGIEVINALKQKGLKTRIVILTTHEADEEVLGALKAGAHGYCIKDISSERLIEVLQTVCEGAAWLDPHIAELALKHFASINTELPVLLQENLALKGVLTNREHNILKLMVEGKSNNDIAKELYISVHTAKFYVSNLLEKLAVTDRVQAAVKAVREGLV
jgi:DNA-binding NarL/FixJ family response regulator